MSKALVNALVIALLDEGMCDITQAREFSARFVEENEELFRQDPLPYPTTGFVAQPATPAQIAEAVRPARTGARIIEDGESIRVRAKPATAGTLTAKQQAALDGGIGLCPNCQQPTNDHIPGCARIAVGGMPPMDPRAVTRSPLPVAE